MNEVYKEEDNSNILDAFFDHPIAYHKIYSLISGSSSSGLLLSQIAYWWGKMHHQFYKTDNDFIEELAMGKYEFKGAQKKLVSLGLITIELKSLPRRTYYTLHIDKMVELINAYSNSVKTRVGKNPTLGLGKTQHKGLEKPNTTSESTTESTTEKETSKEKENGLELKAPISEKELNTLDNDKTLVVDNSLVVKNKCGAGEFDPDRGVPTELYKKIRKKFGKPAIGIFKKKKIPLMFVKYVVEVKQIPPYIKQPVLYISSLARKPDVFADFNQWKSNIDKKKVKV